MKGTRLDFIGFPVDNVGLPEVLDFAERAVRGGSSHFLAVQNANKMYLSARHPALRKAIDGSSLILPENAINIGMRLLGRPLKQRNMGGVHMMEELLGLADKKRYSVYLLGALQESVEALADKIRNDYPGVAVKGFRNGFFRQDEEQKVAASIGELRPHFLFVGMGSPKQELFIMRYFHLLNANISLGVGGSFNVIAGLEKRAPPWAKYGLEWLYRSFLDPKKLKRYMVVNSFFAFRLLRYLATGKS